ncbi:MAG TPA: hypothetical protein ENH55_19830 [Aurantimonas coralicida]|uniref:Mor transcription activator domain-containing protein n=2 Tax=root TaxID=1 RepID=A0A9C9NCZ5_9HYPH|nr:hypothetical protein [Aurantimonas coralicida]HET99496.1 hypothetical protein [Aurantimonas coralicida]
MTNPDQASAGQRDQSRELTIPKVIIDEDTATPSMADIIGVIGEDGAQLLCDRLGGLCLDVGPPNQRFIDVLGLEKAVELRKHMGTGRFFVPRTLISREARHKAIVQARRDGARVHDIAIAFGLGERQVYEVLAKHRQRRPKLSETELKPAILRLADEGTGVPQIAFDVGTNQQTVLRILRDRPVSGHTRRIGKQS